MGMSDGYKIKNSGFVKIGNFGFLKHWTGRMVMKVCDAFMGIAAELGGFRNACPNIYNLIQAPNI